MLRNTEFVELDIMRFACQQRISELEIRMSRDQFELRSFMDQASRCLVAELEWFIAGKSKEEYTDHEEVIYPADWWQAFKQRWLDYRLLRWVLRRYPAKMTTVRIAKKTLVTNHVCPHLPVGNRAKDGSRCIRFAMSVDNPAVGTRAEDVIN